jgi:phosphatidylserine/phosphatidylglycerophosphate/cardiolipin synthase-like enzyme
LFAFAACAAPGDSVVDGHPGSGSGADAKPGTPDAKPGSPDGPTGSSNVTVIVEPNGQSGNELLAAINGASSSIYMTMYEIDDSRIISALVARKKAGLDVQAILDGSSTTMGWNKTAHDDLLAAGVSVVWSSSAFNYTHEKTFIIDGSEAWIMTMNCNTSSPKDNREYLARDTNAADIAEATAIFKADHAHQSITPSGALVVAPTNARPDLVALVDSSTSTVDIEDEEFSDTYSTGVVNAVVRAAKRGVAVRVVIANQTLNAAMQQANSSVKTAGGRIVMTGPTSGNGTPSDPYIHAKAIVVDCSGTTCARGFVGSENLTAGSLGYNRELGVELSDPTELAKIETAIDTDFANGKAQ